MKDEYRPLLVGLGVMLLLFVIWFVIWKFPQWYAASWDKLIDPKDIAKLESDTRTTMVQAVGGLVLLVGLFFTAKTWRTTQEGQITDRFTKAINQLGDDKLQIRLGGIYALERIARDSERDHWPIMEVMTAYVRDRVLIKAEPPTADATPEPTTDIQAILTVLARRSWRKGERDRLALSHTDLRGVHLYNAHLEGADLHAARLERAFLWRACLQRALLHDTHLERADLGQAHLERVNLSRAHLQGAKLGEAHLEGADLGGAHLDGAIDLTIEQLSKVRNLYQAHIDPSLKEQIKQQYPHLLERPQEWGQNS